MFAHSDIQSSSLSISCLSNYGLVFFCIDMACEMASNDTSRTKELNFKVIIDTSRGAEKKEWLHTSLQHRTRT